MSIVRSYRLSKMSFKRNSVRENLFLCACFLWYSRPFSREMDQKCKIGGTIGYGDSYWELIFRPFKVSSRHATLHDAAGAVRAHISKGPGYCYMIGRGPKPCLHGDVTGIRFCFCVKHFSLSVFNSVDLWGSVSCILLEIELADKIAFNG